MSQFSGESLDPSVFTEETSNSDVESQVKLFSDDNSEEDTLETEKDTEEVETEEESEVSNEQESEETSSEEEPTEEQTSDSELKKELDNWKNRYENAQHLIAKHGTELGQLRQLVQQLQDQKPQKEEDEAEFLDTFVQNPKAAIAKELQKREAEVLQRKQHQEQLNQQNLQYVQNSAPDFDNYKQDILEVAKLDGIKNASMDMLNHTLYNDPILALQFYHRAKLMRENNELKTKGKNVVKQLATNSKKTPTLTSGNSKKSSKVGLTDKEISNLSDKQLQELLKQL